MKNLCLSILMLLLFALAAPSQDYNDNAVVDSLITGQSPKEQFKTIETAWMKILGQDGPACIRLAKKLIELSESINEDLYTGQANYFLGISHEMVGQYDHALKACHQALSHFLKTEKSISVARVYNEIGIIYTHFENELSNMKALESFHTFLNMLAPLKDSLEIARAYTNICGVNMQLAQNDSAIFYSRKSIELYEGLNRPLEQANNYINMGILYNLPESMDSAGYYWHLAEDILLQHDQLEGLANIYQNMVEYCINIGQPDKAGEYARKKLALAEKIGSKHVYMKAYEALSLYYESISEYKYALINYKLFKEMCDSTASESTQARMANLEAVYDLDIKDQTITLLKEKDSIKQFKIRVLIGLILSVLAIALLTIYSIIKKRRQDRKIAELEKEKQRLREEELQVQVEYKSKQLTSHALNMMMKNQFLFELEQHITDIGKKSKPETGKELQKLNKQIHHNTRLANDWDLFKNYFEEVNSGFYEALSEKYPGLSSNNYKLCALIKLNMNIKESAAILNISPESIKTARYRLRKKLNLEPQADLHEVIQSIY